MTSPIPPLSAPPVARAEDATVTRHGISVADPYRWLRDPGYPAVEDPAILAHLQAENAWFEQQMAPLRPLVDRLFAELKGRIKEDDYSVPVERHGWLYQWRFAAGEQYRRWYRRPAGGGPEELILDEPALAGSSEFFRLGALAPSPDGRLLAYSVDESGAERFTLRIRDLATGRDLPDAIPDTMGEPVWSTDGTLLLHAVLNPEWRPYQIRAHRLGEPVERSQLLYEEADSGFRVHPALSQSEEIIFLATGDHVTSEVRFVAAADPLAPPTLIAPRRTGVLYDVDHGAGRFVIRSNDTHRNFRLATAAPGAPGDWRELVAGSDGRYLRRAVPFNRLLVIEERIGGLDQIRLCRPDGTERLVPFPEAAYEAELGANPSPDPATLRIEYSSMVRPQTTWALDPASLTLETLKVQEIPSGYEPADYAAVRLEATARDGTRIPISLVHRKGWRPGEGRPLHLYGYGAYGIGMTPGFSASRISLLDRGFAYAIAHIRGGDELGRGWYEDGKLEKRWNTFHDFIDAARFLVEQGYAATGGISISGGSAGGELMGVAANEAPALWRAVVAHVPFVDVLNTMLDPTLPLTPAEWPEWGNPIEDPAAFALIRSYSPYDNVRAQAYPPMLVTAGLNDPRVTYWEPAKWVARLRALKTDGNPLWFKVNMGAGHGGKSGRFERLHEVAEEFAFVLMAFGLDRKG